MTKELDALVRIANALERLATIEEKKNMSQADLMKMWREQSR